MPLTTCFVDVFQSSTHNNTKTSSSSAGSVPTNEACHPQRMYSDMMTIENIAIHSKSFATSQQLHTFPVSNVSSSQMHESPNEMTCLTDSVRKVSPDSNGPYKSVSPPRRNSSQTQIHPLVGMLSSGDSYKAPVHNANPVKDYCSPADKVQEGMSAGKKLSVHVAPFIPQLAKPYTEHREDALRITSTPLVVGTSDLHTNQCRQSTHTLPHRTTAPQVTRVCDHDSKDAQLDAVNIARGHVDLNRYQNGSDLDMKHVAETGLSRVSNIFGVYPTPLRSDLETSSMTTSVPSTQGIALTSQHELLNTYWSMVNVPANNHCLPSRASLGVAPISVIHPMYYPALDHTVFTPTAVTYNPFAAPHVGTMNHRDQTWSSPVYGVMNVSGLSQSGGMAHVEHRNTHNSNISETNLIRRNNMATHQIPGPYTTVSPSGEHKGPNASLTIDPIVRGLGPPMHSDRRLAIPNEDLRVPSSQNHDAQRSRNRNHNGRSSRTCMPSKTSVSEFPRKTYNTNIGPTGSHSFVSAPIEFSPREEEFVQYLRGRFFIEPRSIAVVVLKAIIESSDPTTVELYRDVMSPYRNSFHSFFDWHSDHFLLWNYKSDEIGALSLAPYFKQDETRVASRHFSYSSITEADRNYAQCLRKEENALVQHLVDRLKREGMSTMPRREVLEFLRADFPSSRIPGGLLCSANSFNRFVSRHNDVIACTATFITLRNNYNQIKERLARSTDQTKGELHTSADVLTEPIGMNIYPTHTAVNSGKEIFECANENVCVDLHQICADLLCVNKMCNLSQPISLQMDPACGLGNNSGVTNSSDSSDSEYNKIKVLASSGTSSDGRSVAGPVSCDPEDCDAVSF